MSGRVFEHVSYLLTSRESAISFEEVLHCIVSFFVPTKLLKLIHYI
jgi:hypothetical protein